MPSYLTLGGSAAVLARWSRVHNLFARCVEIAESKARGGYMPVLFRADDHRYNSADSAVDAFRDYFDRAHEIQASGADRVLVLPTSNSNFGGAVAANIGGVTRYASNRPAAEWGFLSDGQGGEFLHVVRLETSTGTKHVLHTTFDPTNAASEAGSYCAISGTSGASNKGVAFRIAAGGLIVNSDVTSGLISTLEASYIGGSFVDGSPSDTFSVQSRGRLGGSGGATGAALATPTRTLTMFANAGAEADNFTGKWAESWFIPGGLTADERKTFFDYLAEKFKIYQASNDVPVELGAVAWWDPAYGITLGTGVSAWADRVSGIVLSEATGSQQPTLVGNYLRFTAASLQALTYDGAAFDYVGLGLNRSASCVYCLHRWETLSGITTGFSFLQASNAASTARQRTNGTTSTAQFTNTSPIPAEPIAAGADYWMYLEDNGIDTVTERVRGGAARTVAASDNTYAYDRLVLCSRGDGQQFGDARIYGLVVFDGALTSGEHAQMQAWSDSVMGL
jgi:hypothetical protein